MPWLQIPNPRLGTRQRRDESDASWLGESTSDHGDDLVPYVRLHAGTSFSGATRACRKLAMVVLLPSACGRYTHAVPVQKPEIARRAVRTQARAVGSVV